MKISMHSTAGITISNESIRSSMPPCPGSMLPESFTWVVRLMSDSTRSPHVANTETTTLNRIIVPILNSEKYAGQKLYITIAAAMQNTIPPQNPSHDFLGEMRSKRRWRPMALPMRKAPVSFSQMNMNMARTIWRDTEYTIVERARGSAM